ncbi:TPA: hypothetical protein ACNZ7B_005808, partial [Klebsiella quasipneumoniae subsp. similipneumoniae]
VLWDNHMMNTDLYHRKGEGLYHAMLCGIKYAQRECPQYPYKTRVISDDIAVINMSRFIIQRNSYPESL